MRKQVYFVNKEFPLFPELRMLILKAVPANRSVLAKRIGALGRVKLAVLAGVFINSDTSRADLLIVGDGIKKGRLNSFMAWLESEIGKELNYVALTTDEFKYRMDMYDRFLRDILEDPHEKVINKLGV
ncbi:MAG: hypothetical protein Q7K44_05165 [Candidatus Liptonbacteria bacterium]|nr:hypothetical protein [Candidatus Liptonbacteria bacterium]